MGQEGMGQEGGLEMSFSSARERERGLNVRTWSQLKSFVDIEQISLPTTPFPPDCPSLSYSLCADISRGWHIYTRLEAERRTALRSFSFRSAQSYRHSWSTRRSASCRIHLRSFEINFDIYCAIENSRLIMINCKDDG